MKHLGDITKINGAEIETVDVITGGSPCQDLSIAGKRAGLAGARSGLFMEQIRIVKEMRAHDKANGRTGDMVRPRFMVWENVPGAFSSNKGQDFAAVLEEIIRIAEPEAPDIEVPEKGWNTWGGYHDEVGGRWSVAWRVHDAQHWGVPQRRRRISVVADFGGDTAGEILFERKSVSRHFAESGTARERLAGNTKSGASYAVRIRGGCDGGGKGALVQEDKSGTLGTSNDQTIFQNCLTQWDCQSKRIFGTEGASPTLQGGVGGGVNNPAIFCMGTQQGGAEVRSDDRAPTLTAAAGMSGNNQPMICAAFKAGQGAKANGIGYAEEQAPTLNAECGGNKPAVVALGMTHACDVIRECGEIVPSLQARMGTGGNQVPLTYQMQGFGDYREGDVVSSCKQRDYKDSTDLVVSSVDCRNFTEGGEINGALQAKESVGQSLNLQNTVRTGMIVRRLTPMECERLQGFPDHWTDIGEWRDSKGKLRKPSDSPRYKALGNSIALPFWDFLAKRISAQYLRPVTMGSLFDGIGGFPLVFERHNGKGTARWASEIEEFPIAVTKLRFGEDA
jgi:DNA (cytosine-5)-methyltransferase 1|nr:MAG TPA: Cytosine specific methyltransferase [Caudoviricetes sp.]